MESVTIRMCWIDEALSTTNPPYWVAVRLVRSSKVLRARKWSTPLNALLLILTGIRTLPWDWPGCLDLNCVRRLRA